MNDFVTSIIRTYVPILVGAAITWLATKGIEVEENVKLQLVAGLTGLVSAVYYGAVRLLEQRWGTFGLLLGSRKTPKY